MASCCTSVRVLRAPRTRRASSEACDRFRSGVVVDRLVALVVRRVAAGRRLGGPDPVHRLAVRDRQDPGERAALGLVEPAGGAPDLEERLLGHLLGLGRVADDPERQAEDARRGGVVQAGERRLVGPAGPPKQVGQVGRGTGLGPRLAVVRRGAGVHRSEVIHVADPCVCLDVSSSTAASAPSRSGRRSRWRSGRCRRRRSPWRRRR